MRQIALINDGENAIGIALAELQRRLSSEQGRKSFDEILSLRATYRAGQQQFLKLASTGATTDASPLPLGQLRQQQERYVGRLKAADAVALDTQAILPGYRVLRAAAISSN